MKGEVLEFLQTQIYREISLKCKVRIILVEPITDHWPTLTLANHNVFRLDGAGNVVWQVRRDEQGYVNWEVRHARAKAKDPAVEGYFDPFWNMGLDESQAHSADPAGVYRAGCVVRLNTRWWEYVLDVETGIATCTGEQVK